MKKLFSILRRERGAAQGYLEKHEYEMKSDDDTVASALSEIGDAIAAAGLRPLVWEHSCLQKRCGACAMVICKRPMLACDARLSVLPEEITVEPLFKFPVIEDLLVDRSSISKRLIDMGAYTVEAVKEYSDKKKDELTYQAMRCLQCGLCLEVCPNYPGRRDYGGMAAMTVTAQILSQTDDENREQVRELKKKYKDLVYEGCGKALACRDVCPVELPMDELLSRTNAAAVWGRGIA